jgi:hypothetical protein
MRIYHGTTPQFAKHFVKYGIDAHLISRRAIHGPQDGVPGIFVTPKLSVARRFGLCVIEIEVTEDNLFVPPNLAVAGATLSEALDNEFEPQAFISNRIEPSAIRIVECRENGYSFNSYASGNNVASNEEG